MALSVRNAAVRAQAIPYSRTPPAWQQPARVRLLRWLGPCVAFLLFFVALYALRRELDAATYSEITHAFRGIPATRVLFALALTAIAYAILAGYDALALRYAGRTGGRSVPSSRVALASFIAYGLSQTLGFPALTGSAVRYRFWSAWGLSAVEIARAAAFVGFAFTSGALLVTGFALLLEPAAMLARASVAETAARSVGLVLLVVGIAPVAWSLVQRGRSMRVPPWLGRQAAGWEIPVPARRLVLAQIAVAILDWTVAAAVLYVLLPDAARIGFIAFAGIFAIAQLAGLLSHVPAGLGVFDTIMVVLLQPDLPAGAALATLAAYRAVYYLLPFAVAATLLVAREARARREQLGSLLATTARAARAAGETGRASGAAVARLGPTVVPTMASLVTFVAGAMLLFSGALPSLPHRVGRLHAVLPLGVIEASHLIGSISGATLLVLAWALRRRLDAAWALAMALLALGIVVSLLKGLDWEEALVLTLALAALAPFRGAFYRKASLTAEPFEPGWVLAVLAVVGASVWLGTFSHQHVEYTHDLWWQFAARGDVPRFLRASVAASAALAAFGMLRVLRHAGAEPTLPTADDFERAREIITRSDQTVGNLALLGDKALLFDRDGQGFVQYAVSGRSWVALGDPVAVAGDQGERVRDELAWRLKEEADRHGGWPVFYELPATSLPRYIDLGLTFLKVGEEARVNLTEFSLEGGARKGLRRVVKDVERAGARFEVVAADAVGEILPALRAVSDDWLAHKNVREKGFSLGYFEETYLRNFPIAVVRVGGTPDNPGGDIVAFANVWAAGQRADLAVDLMRFAAGAPKGVMDYLFVQLMLWGKVEGYLWFNLGMAPLSGFEARQLGPAWTRVCAWLYRHGEHFYNFQGLRHYKDKFDPVWEPRYLASPGGLVLPRVLANVTSVISGGVAGMFRK